MSTYLPQDVQDDMDAARLARLKRRNRLRVVAGSESWPVLKLWRTGFAVEGTDAVPLRGLVDIYDGATHLYQCLIVAGGLEGGAMHYEFKRHTPSRDRAPLDHFSEEGRPVALLPR